MSESGSGTRVARSGPFLVLIVGLPREYTWKDLKDLVRPKASHSIWTDVDTVAIGGQTYSKHSIRLGLWPEACASYTHIRQQSIPGQPGRQPFVELWDITDPPAILLRRNFDPTHPSMQTHPREVERLAQGNYWVQVAPNFTHQTMMQVTVSGQMPQTSMAPPQAYGRQAIPTNYPTQQYTPAQWAQIQANQAAQRQAPIQQQTIQATHNGTTASGLPVNTGNGAAIVEFRAVFVHGLSYKAKESEIAAYFSSAGRIVSCKLQVDHRTRKSKGCAKVEYGSRDEAKTAVYYFDGERWMGRELGVRLDRDTTVVSPPAANPRPLIVDGSAGARSRS